MPAARVERWFLRVMLGVSVVAWLALLLAELGQFRLGLLALLLTIGAFGLSLLVYAFRASPATPTAAAGWLKPALAATAGILLCAALFLPPYETAVQGGDATVYLNFGRQIARHGALEFEDALLGSRALARHHDFESRGPPHPPPPRLRTPPDIVEKVLHLRDGFLRSLSRVALIRHERGEVHRSDNHARLARVRGRLPHAPCPLRYSPH